MFSRTNPPRIQFQMEFLRKHVFETKWFYISFLFCIDDFNQNQISTKFFCQHLCMKACLVVHRNFLKVLTREKNKKKRYSRSLFHEELLAQGIEIELLSIFHLKISTNSEGKNRLFFFHFCHTERSTPLFFSTTKMH